jgi:hypothetical protein
MAQKTCPMCCSEIPEVARKCPHCQHFQSRAALLFHPATAAFIVIIPMAISLIIFATMFDPGEEFAPYSNQIAVTNTHIAFGETKSGATIAVLGEIRNDSPVPWNDINLHAHFKDPSGRTIDVATEDKYSFHLPAHSTSQFKLSFRREFPETNYAQHTVRVLFAKDSRSRW